jgi:DnaJ-class molecular chaperone
MICPTCFGNGYLRFRRETSEVIQCSECRSAGEVEVREVPLATRTVDVVSESP